MEDSTPTERTYPPLLTKKQLAREFFGVTERTIDRWLLDGALPAEAKFVIGGSVRFRTAVLLDHIASGVPANEGGDA